MTSDEVNGLGYFYSTIAQSIAAIIALFGLFATFRIQYSNMQKEAALNSLRNYIELKCFHGSDENILGYSYVDRDVQCWLDKDVPAHLREIIKRGNVRDNSMPMGFVDYYLFINSIESFTQYLVRYLIKNMVSLGLFLVFNLIALIGLIYEWGFLKNPCLIGATILFFIFMLWAIIDYTKKSLKGPDFIFINNNETNKSYSETFSMLEIDKIIKNIMTEKNLSKHIIETFKARI